MALINLEQLYRGYVLSFDSLCIPIDEYKKNRPLFTHQVISYWSRTGLSLGFKPWCEEERMDLAWYDEDDEPVLHLESENDVHRLENTIKKLNESAIEFKVGIIHASTEYDDGWTSEIIEDADRNNYLYICTWWKPDEMVGDHYRYLVTGHLIENRKSK